jgi:hypothetical protein
VEGRPDEGTRVEDRGLEDEVVDPATYTVGDRHQYSATVGARVGAVLTAAEKAGEQIVALAREEAADVVRQAQSEAEGQLRRRREEAEAEARHTVDGARAEAARITREAEERAREIEDAARDRQRRLDEDTRLLRERVDWAREGLETITDRLHDVLSTRPAPPEPERAPEASEAES